VQFSRLLLGIYLSMSLFACQSKDAALEIPARKEYSFHGSVIWDSLVLKPDKGLVYYVDQPFTGLAIKHHANGIQASSEAYKGGKREGLFEKWFASGLKSYSCPYTAGKREGTAYSWWKNGNLRSEANYAADIPHGLQKQWYVGGSLFKILQLNQGKEEGIQQSWRENGKLYNNYEAVNGRIFGLKRSKLCFSLDEEVVQYDK